MINDLECERLSCTHLRPELKSEREWSFVIKKAYVLSLKLRKLINIQVR